MEPGPDREIDVFVDRLINKYTDQLTNSPTQRFYMSGTPPNLGDIQKDLKDFLSQKYGADVQFAQPEQEGTATDPPAEEDSHPEIEFDMNQKYPEL